MRQSIAVALYKHWHTSELSRSVVAVEVSIEVSIE